MIREALTLENLRSRPADEAAAWLAVRSAEGADEQDAGVVAEWLALEPAHPDALDRAKRALACFDDAEGDPLLEALRAEARSTARRSGAAWTRPLAAAAALLLVAFGGWFVVQSRGGFPGAPSVGHTLTSVAQAQRYATPKGPPAVFRLADGTVMTLDAESAATVAYGRSRRDVQLLRGRASFDVVHDPQRPFAVRAADREIVAVGTQFDVRLDPGRVRVVLIKGRLRVNGASPSDTAILEAGQQLEAPLGGRATISAADLQAADDWRHGLVTFNNETLAAATAELNRYSRDQLVVRDPAVASLRISGVFRAGDLPRFGRTLSVVQPVRIVQRGPHELEVVHR